jgi:drug/metabolite transporter (DMT)-like permease
LIFRGDLSISGWNFGDAAALASGAAWSVGAALVFINPGLSARSIGLATTVGAILTSAVILALDPASGRFAPVSPGEALLVSLAGGVFFLAPIILVTMWGALRLPPATISFLLTAEIIAGVASSAFFLDERFGWPEAAGPLLIALAALIEVILPPVEKHGNVGTGGTGP